MCFRSVNGFFLFLNVNGIPELFIARVATFFHVMSSTVSVGSQRSNCVHTMAIYV